jgi:hypothetical protein
MRIEKTILLENYTDTLLSINSIRTGCNCVEVMPKTRTAEPGHAIELEIAMMRDKFSRVVNQEFTLNIDASGPIKNLSIALVISLTSHVSFESNVNHVKYTAKTGRSFFKVPVIFSPDVKINEFEVKTSEGLTGIVDVKLVSENGLANVECNFDSSLVSSETAGTISLVRKSEKTKPVGKDCAIIFSESKWFRVLPGMITFVPATDPGKANREANAIVRMITPTPDTGKIETITCVNSKGLSLPIEFKFVRDGFYRIVISSPESGSVVAGERLKITASTPLGSVEESVSVNLAN